MDDDSDFDVGYGKPPKSGQFQKGKSGNPRGRPKGSSNIGGALRTALNKKIPVSIDGRQKQMPIYEAYANRLAQTLLTGKPADQIRAWKEIERLVPNIPKSINLPNKIAIEIVKSDGNGGMIKRPISEFLDREEKGSDDDPEPIDPLDC